MNIKNQRIYGICLLTIGALVNLIVMLSGAESEYDTYLGGLAAGIMVIGIVTLLRLKRLAGNDEKAREYEASAKDERTIFIVNKARSMTFFISTLGELAAGIICHVFFHNSEYSKLLCAVSCCQCLIYTVMSWIYNRKY